MISYHVKSSILWKYYCISHVATVKLCTSQKNSSYIFIWNYKYLLTFNLFMWHFDMTFKYLPTYLWRLWNSSTLRWSQVWCSAPTISCPNLLGLRGWRCHSYFSHLYFNTSYYTAVNHSNNQNSLLYKFHFPMAQDTDSELLAWKWYR